MTTNMDTDKILIRRVRSGDGKAGAEFYHRHAAGLFTLLRSLLHHEDAAADVLQKFFQSLFENPESYLRADNFKGYLYSSARNLALKNLRGQTRYRQVVEEYGKFQLTCGKSTGEMDLNARALEEALQTLPLECRTVLVLHLYEGFTFSEIETLTETPERTLFRRYKSALDALRTLFDKEDN